MKEFKALVKEAREKKNLMMMDLAANIKVSVAYVSQIENENSPVLPGEDVATRLITELAANPAHHKQLETAYKRAVSKRKVERIFPSSEILEELLGMTGLSANQIRQRLKTDEGEKRSRQSVQVWKQGLLLPGIQAATDLMAVLREENISEKNIIRYMKARLYDAVYFSSAIEHISEENRQQIAAYAVSVEYKKHNSAKA